MICGRSLVRPSLLTARGLDAVGVGDPQVLDAGAVAEKGDLLAVGRVARLAFERQAADDARGGAAVDRQRVEVAENVEDERAAVRRHVERRPRHFVGRELERFAGRKHQRLGFRRIRARLLVLPGRSLLRERLRTAEHQGRQQQQVNT